MLVVRTIERRARRRADAHVHRRRWPLTRRGCSYPAEPSADIDDLLCILRDNLGKADAFITTAEALIVRSWHDEGDESDDDSVIQRRNPVEYLVEAAKLAVRAAEHTGRELKALAQRQRGA